MSELQERRRTPSTICPDVLDATGRGWSPLLGSPRPHPRLTLTAAQTWRAPPPAGGRPETRSVPGRHLDDDVRLTTTYPDGQRDAEALFRKSVQKGKNKTRKEKQPSKDVVGFFSLLFYRLFLSELLVTRPPRDANLSGYSDYKHCVLRPPRLAGRSPRLAPERRSAPK